MNDNHENMTEESEEEFKDPAVKKVAKISAFVYLGLAIAVVIVATVGIFSVSYDYETSLESLSIPEIDFAPESSLPQINVSLPDVDDTPVGNEQSNVDAEISDENPPRVMFYRPVEGEIIKPHSMDKLVYSETLGDYRVHCGIDIAAELGAEVIAFSDGRVASVVTDYFKGVTVAITHDQGVISYYSNLDAELAEGISVGAEVLAGQPIGTVGTTARNETLDPPHLHFELKVNGADIDPEPELP